MKGEKQEDNQLTSHLKATYTPKERTKLACLQSAIHTATNHSPVRCLQRPSAQPFPPASFSGMRWIR